MATRCKYVPRTVDIDTAFQDAKSDAEALKEEMENWRDNMEEKLSATQKFEEVSEAADQMDTVCQSLDDAEQGVNVFVNIFDKENEGKTDARFMVTYSEAKPSGRKGPPRWMRANDVSAALNAVKDALEKKVEEMRKKDDELSADDAALADEMEEAAQQIDEATSNLDGVCWPSMF